MEVQTAPTAELVVLLQDSGLDDSKTHILRSRFADYFTIAEQWKTESRTLVVTHEDQTELMKRARQGRLVLKDKRVAIERTRKELKKESLKESRAIDAVAKLLTSLIEPTEKFLLKQEEFAKRAAEKRLAERDDLIYMRRETLLRYDHAGTPDAELGEMSQADFNGLRERVKLNHEARQHECEAEQEKQRQADQRNRDELLKENQRLQEEARVRDQQRNVERREQEREQQKLRDEARALRDAEIKRKRQADEEQRQQQLQTAALTVGSDKQKLVGFADRIRGIVLLGGPKVQGDKARQVVLAAEQTLDKIQNWLREQADTL